MDTRKEILAAFAPVTFRGYLVQANIPLCAEAIISEYKRRYIEFEHVWHLPIPTLRLQTGITELAQGLKSLYPLTKPPTRYLVVSTEAAGWTAVFNNNSYDENQEFMAGLNRIVGGRVVYYFSVEHTLKKVRSNRYVGQWGGYALYIFDTGRPMEPDRVISCIKENGGWKFDQCGEPLPFEDINRYRLPIKRDRFDGQLLRDYLKAMGFCPYDVSFFRVSDTHPAILVERMDSGHEKDPIRYMSESQMEEQWYMELGIPLRVFKTRT